MEKIHSYSLRLNVTVIYCFLLLLFQAGCETGTETGTDSSEFIENVASRDSSMDFLPPIGNSTLENGRSIIDTIDNSIINNTSANITNGQDLKLFDLRVYYKGNSQKSLFISLSDIYLLSDHSDSLAMPALPQMEIEDKKKYEYFKLESEYRKRFLSGTKVSESDTIYIYNYSSDIQISIPVKNTTAVACLNVYGANWPYRQDDYMIGFEIDQKYLSSSDKHFNNTLVYIGKVSPFYLGQMKNILWKKIDSKDFPQKAINTKLLEDLKKYYGYQENRFSKGDVHKFESDSLQYFIQDLKPNTDIFPLARRLLVVSNKTKEIIYENFYIESEGISMAPLNEQWTGKLIKNKPPVIFGFEYNSFGCLGIPYISQTEKSIPIECDNRH